MPGAPCVRPAATAHVALLDHRGGTDGGRRLREPSCASARAAARPTTSPFGEEAAARATPKRVADARRAGNVLA
eukprot:scaffold135506_cov386-Phaeocystis_antarctica.AAC.1